MDIQQRIRTKTHYEKRDIQTVARVAWPSALESFFVALAGLVDSYMVSNLGSVAVAAVGLTSQPKFVGLAAFVALKIAISALVARRYGEGDRKTANSILVMGLIFTLVGSAVISAVCVAFAEPIMWFVGASEDTHQDSVIYFRIIMGGMIFNTVQMTINAALRGMGNTKIAMRTNVTANVVNIIGNYLLIEGHLGFPALGIAGAAIATVFGTVVACVMSIVSVCRRDNFVSMVYIIKNKIGFCRDQIGAMGKLVGSEFVEQLLVRVGFMLTAMLAANLGTAPFAAHQIGMNFMSVSFAFGDGLSVAAVALIGKSLGEKKPEQAKMYGNICQRFALVISVILAVFYLLGGRPLFSLFFEEQEIIEYGVQITRVMAIVTMLQTSHTVYNGSLRGAGDVVYVMIISTLAITVFRPITAYLASYVLELGIVGIWWGVVADHGTRLTFGYLRYRAGKWTKIKI